MVFLRVAHMTKQIDRPSRRFCNVYNKHEDY